jgi:hypothetical protein
LGHHIVNKDCFTWRPFYTAAKKGEFIFSNKYRLVIYHFTDLDDCYSKTHFTTSNERKYAYTFYPYKHLLNRAAQFGEVVTD